MSSLMKIGIVFLIVVMFSIILRENYYSRKKKPVVENISEGECGYPGSEFWFNELLKSPGSNRIPTGIMQKEARFVNTLPKRKNLITKSENEKVLSWEPNGPFNIGGRTKVIAVDITNENIILAGSDAGGIWRSVDGGVSWEKRTMPNQNQFIRSLAQDTRSGKTNIWYCGTYGYWSDHDSPNSGIYKSTDNGLTWYHLPPPWLDTTVPATGRAVVVNKIILNPGNLTEDEVFAAVQYRNQTFPAKSLGNIIRSTDGGKSWIPVLGGENNYHFSTDIAITQQSNVFYASLSYDINNTIDRMEGGLWRSIDGVNWINITPPDWISSFGNTVIAPAPSNENIVYFLRARGSDHDLFKYTYLSGDGSDSGGIWENRSESINNRQGRQRFYSYSGSFLMISVKPDDENTVFIGGLQLHRSTDGFSTKNYKNIITGGFHVDQGGMVFSPSDPNTAYFSNDGGLYKTKDVSSDSVVYGSLNNGYRTSQFYTIALDHSAIPDNNVIIGGMQDNGTVFTNSGVQDRDWSEIKGGDGVFTAIAENRSSYYVSIQGGNISRFKIDENGISDHETGRYTRIDPIQGVTKHFIQPFILNPANKDMMFYPGGNYIYRNSDLTKIPKYCEDPSQYWEKLVNTFTDDRVITALEMSVEPKNRLYYATTPLGASIYRLDESHIGNKSVKKFTSTVLPVSAKCNSIAIDRKDADRVILTVSGYETPSVFYSSDGG